MMSVVESAYGSVLYLEVKVAVPNISGGSISDSGGEVGDMTLVVVLRVWKLRCLWSEAFLVN